jgi:HlyD family secretion protein
MKKFFQYILRHKIASVIILILAATAGYYLYKSVAPKGAAVRYVTGQVQKGTIVVSLSGTGQVSASNQLDLKPKASGDVTYVGVRAGQPVKAGTLIAQFDSTAAQKSVRDAQANVQSAKLSLQKLQQPPASLSITQAEDAVARAQESKQNSENGLVKAYQDGFNNVANAFLDLPTIMTGLQNILYSSSPGLGGGNQTNINYYGDVATQYDSRGKPYRNDADQKYQSALSAYNQTFDDYKAASRTSPTSTVESLIDETYHTTKSIAESVKSVNNLIQLYKDVLTKQNLSPASLASTHLDSLNTYVGETNTHLTNLLSSQTTIQSDKTGIVDSQRTINEDTQSLASLQAGPNAIDLQSAQLSLQQKENALLDAQQTLADYSVYVPFDGTVAKVNVKKGDTASSGTAVATLITNQQLATISLNEVDVAKVKLGQKATLSFDAIDGLTITGEVAEIDPIGTVSQGVVNYSVQIGFDTQDDRVKSGMSVSAAIITEAKQDVLTVANSAVKSDNIGTYVQILDARGQPQNQTVQVGISNDTLTEITSGLQEGQSVITQTINTSSSSATTGTTQRSTGGLGIPGLGGGGAGGGAIRRAAGD